MCQLVKCVEFEIRSYVATLVSVQSAFSFTGTDGTLYDQGRMIYKNNEGIQFQVFSGETGDGKDKEDWSYYWLKKIVVDMTSANRTRLVKIGLRNKTEYGAVPVMNFKTPATMVFTPIIVNASTGDWAKWTKRTINCTLGPHRYGQNCYCYYKIGWEYKIIPSPDNSDENFPKLL